MESATMPQWLAHEAHPEPGWASGNHMFSSLVLREVPAGDARCGFVFLRKNALFRDHPTSSTGRVCPMLYEKTREITQILMDIFFCTTRRKKRDRAPRWRWIVDFLQVTVELQNDDS